MHIKKGIKQSHNQPLCISFLVHPFLPFVGVDMTRLSGDLWIRFGDEWRLENDTGLQR